MKNRGWLFVTLCFAVSWLAGCNSNAPNTDTTPPAVPTGLTATAGNQAVTLSWQTSAEDDVKQVNIYQRSGDELEKVASETGSSFTVTGLTNGQTYVFAIDAEDNSGNRSEKTAEVSATPAASGATATPTLVSSSPEDGDTNVALNASLRLTFSKAMNATSTQAAITSSPPIACDFSWNAAADTLSCTPATPMTASTSYTVTVASTAQDTAANPLTSSASFSFTTGTDVLAVCTFDTGRFNACVFGN